MTANFDEFRQFLIDTGKSARTNSGYQADLELFARWFLETNGEMLRSDNLTPTDIRAHPPADRRARAERPLFAAGGFFQSTDQRFSPNFLHMSRERTNGLLIRSRDTSYLG
jgi:hypothetical protein